MSQPQQGNSPVDFRVNLRFLFVQLLFSLAAGELGIQAANLVLREDSIPWQCLYAGLAHLFLAGTVISTSWVGWCASKIKDNDKDFFGVFSEQFLVMLIDVTLVVIYFMLVRTAEVPKATAEKPTLMPSALWPCRLMFATFVLYMVWDFVTKRSDLKYLWKRGRWTVLSACLSFGILIFLSDVRAFPSVILVDLALLSVDFSFRAFKDNPERFGFGYGLAIAAVLLSVAAATESSWSREIPIINIGLASNFGGISRNVSPHIMAKALPS